MNSGLKTILAIALLVAGVFGVTVISQISPRPAPTNLGGGNSASGEVLPPLAYRFTDYIYDPKADLETNYPYRLFNGFFEVGTGGNNTGPRNWVGFAMRNKRPTPAVLVPLPPSCPKCTSARMATFPDSAIQSYLTAAAAGNFFSVGGAPNPLSAIAWAEQMNKAEWFTFDFSDLKKTFTIPAAPRPESPTWAFLELDFKVAGAAPPGRPVKALFEVYDDKKHRLQADPLIFSVVYAQCEPYEVWPKEFSVGELPEGVASRSVDVYAFSMTRDLSRLVPPAVVVNGNDPAVSVSEPKPMSDDDRERFAVRLGNELKSPVRIAGGYRYTVTVLRQAPGTAPDVGEFEKVLQFGSNLSQRSYSVVIKGTVTGDVRLDGLSKIDLGSYESTNRFKKEVRLVSEKPEIELELVPERCEPKFVTLNLGKPDLASGRKTWPLTATIAEQQGRRQWSGVVVLRTVGPNPVTFRFPISGFGR